MVGLYINSTIFVLDMTKTINIEGKDFTIEQLKEMLSKAEQSNWRDEAVGRWDVCGLIGSTGEFSPADCDENYPLHYKTEEEAQRFADKINLFNEMNHFALIHNEGWKADWKDVRKEKFGVGHRDGFEVVDGYVCNTFLFGISVRTEEIADKMLDEFKDRLEVYND